MKTLQILFFTFLMFILFSCEVPYEKPPMGEKEEVKDKTSDSISKIEKFRQNDFVSDKLKKIYETFGLNRRNKRLWPSNEMY
jgi:hypothetical protein